MIQHLLSPATIHAFGWTLIHAVWQGALFAILLAVMLVLLNKYSAKARYVTGVGLLFGFFITTLITFFQLYYSHQIWETPHRQTSELMMEELSTANEFGEKERTAAQFPKLKNIPTTTRFM